MSLTGVYASKGNSHQTLVVTFVKSSISKCDQVKGCHDEGKE